MKKVLLATTALVAFTGAAAAEVTISGSAKMGLIGGDRFVTNTNTNVNTITIGTVTFTTTTTTTTTVDQETQFFNDVDIRFTLSGESDSGLSFGAVVDLDESGNLGREEDNQGTSVFLSGNFGTLTMGDTDGALDWALTDAGNIGNPGTMDDAETSHGGYLGGYGDGEFDNQIVRYDYTFDSFGIAISMEQGANSSDGILVNGDPDGSMAIGVRYALDLGASSVNLGAGYHSADFGTGTDQTIWGLSVSGSFGGGFSAGIVYSDWSDVGGSSGDDATHIGVGVGYESGPIALHANYGEYDYDFMSDVSGFGLSAAYDLGGGLSVNFGYGSTDEQGSPSVDIWSLGMIMSF